MKVKKLFLISLLMGSLLNAGCISEPVSYWMPLNTPWDISKKDNTLEKVFSVAEYNIYTLSITFSPIDKNAAYTQSDFKKIQELDTFLGSAQVPGTVLPVHYKIEKIYDDKPSHLVAEETVSTRGTRSAPYQMFARGVTGVLLHPGKYRIIINSHGVVPMPVNMQASVELYAEPKTIPLPDDGQE